MRERIFKPKSSETTSTGRTVGVPSACAEYEERRHEPRLDCPRTVKVTILGPGALRLCGQLVNVSRTGAAILLDRALPYESAVQIELDDALLMGEVRWCSRRASTVIVGLSVEHWLPNLRELAQWKEDIFGSGP